MKYFEPPGLEKENLVADHKPQALCSKYHEPSRKSKPWMMSDVLDFHCPPYSMAKSSKPRLWLLIGRKETKPDFGSLESASHYSTPVVDACFMLSVGQRGRLGAPRQCVPPLFCFQRQRKFHPWLRGSPIIPGIRHSTTHQRACSAELTPCPLSKVALVNDKPFGVG